jgi:hypothetical protein
MELAHVKSFVSNEWFVKTEVLPPSWMHTERQQWWFSFPNDLCASVLRGSTTYGGRHGLFELAVMFGGQCYYGTPVTSDVLGHLNESEVLATLDKIASLVEDEDGDWVYAR